MRSVRVLMLDPSFSAAGYLHNLCNALVRGGCQVDLFTGPHFERARRCWRDIAYTPRVTFYRRTQLRSYDSQPLMRWMWRLLRLGGHVNSLARLTPGIARYDVLHLHFPPVVPLDAAWLRLIRHRIPVVHTVHDAWPHDARGIPAVRRRLRSLYLACRRLIAHTDETVRDLVTDFGIPRERISRIPHGNFRHWLDQRRGPALDGGRGDAPTILSFGQLRPYKGVDALLRAAAVLRDRGLDFRVLIAGAPRTPAQPYIDLAHELDLDDRVTFDLRYIEEEEVPSYFEAASVVALPYRAIDQSGVAIGALTMGRAVVATRVAGLAELVEQGDCGLLVPSDDVEALAAALAQLVTDRRLRRRLEANARHYAETALAWEPIAERTIDVYRSAGTRRHRSTNYLETREEGRCVASP